MRRRGAAGPRSAKAEDFSARQALLASGLYSPLPPRKNDETLAAPAGDLRGSPAAVGSEGLGDREGGGTSLRDAGDGPLPHLAPQDVQEDGTGKQVPHRARG